MHKSYRHFIFGFLTLLFFGQGAFVPDSQAVFQLRNNNALRVVQSPYNGTSGSFQVRADINESNFFVKKNVEIAPPPSIPLSPTTTPEPIVESPKTSSGGGSGYKYNAGKWLLKRKYDELAAQGKTEDTGFHSAASKKDSETEKNIEPLEAQKDANNLETQKDDKNLEAQKNTKNLETQKAVQELEPQKDPKNLETGKVIQDLKNKEDTKSLEIKKAIQDLEIEKNTENKNQIKLQKNITCKITAIKESACQEQRHYYFPQNNDWELIARILFLCLIFCFLGYLLLFFLVSYMIYKNRQKEASEAKSIESQKKKRKNKWQKKVWNILILFLLLFFGSFLWYNYSFAVITAPQNLIYEGELLDSNGEAVTGSYDFRFSLWDNQDYEATDVIAGNINTGSIDYLGWQEVQSFLIAENSHFSFKLGSVNTFPLTVFDQINISLQVEVKSSGAPDTAYEIIDLDINDNLIDRMVMDSVPFAFNADKLDFREAGFGAGQIPYLDFGAKFNNSVIPDIDAVLLDGRDTGYLPGNIPYIDDTTGLIPDSIIETGTDPGDIARIDSSTGLLPASIIPVVTGSGSVSITGTDVNSFIIDLDDTALATESLTLQFGNTLGETLSWNGLTSQFELSDDLLVSGNLTVSGLVNGVNIGLRNDNDRLSPRYPNSLFEADGTNNKKGYMYEETEVYSGESKNILRWESKDTTTQDYDIIIHYPLNEYFSSFQANSFSVEYQTEGGLADSKLDITAEKLGILGVDQLLGSGLNLSSNTFTQTNFTLDPTTTWTKGETLILKIKVASKNSNNVRLGDIVIKKVSE